MTSAFLGPMTPPQQQQLINDLKNDPKSILHSLLTPHKVSRNYMRIDFPMFVLFFSLCIIMYLILVSLILSIDYCFLYMCDTWHSLYMNRLTPV